MERWSNSPDGVHPSTSAEFFQHITNILREISAADDPVSDYLTEEFHELVSLWGQLEHEWEGQENSLEFEVDNKRMTITFAVKVEDVTED